jgi:hypothetical protein
MGSVGTMFKLHLKNIGMTNMFQKLDDEITLIYKEIDEKGYEAYRHPMDLYDKLMSTFYEICNEHSIDKESDMFYNLRNEYEDKIHKLSNIFWEW